jgi:hypothetical protein
MRFGGFTCRLLAVASTISNPRASSRQPGACSNGEQPVPGYFKQSTDGI